MIGLTAEVECVAASGKVSSLNLASFTSLSLLVSQAGTVDFDREFGEEVNLLNGDLSPEKSANPRVLL